MKNGCFSRKMLVACLVGHIMFPPILARAQSNTLAHGGSLYESTHLIEIANDTHLSLKTRGLRYGGFETSGGDWVDFNKWYSAKWHDTRLSFMTQVNSNFGVIWGLSTGERAQKYEIDPGLRLGFVFQAQTAKHSGFSVTGSTVVGGRLKEKPCVGYYQADERSHVVNCRLAASVLPPAETLRYLINEKPESSVQIRYRRFFD